MLAHATVDKLTALRLPALAEALHRQLGNPLVFADPHLVHIFTVVHSSQIARRAAASEVRLVKTTVCQSTAPHPNKNP